MEMFFVVFYNFKELVTNSSTLKIGIQCTSATDATQIYLV